MSVRKIAANYIYLPGFPLMKNGYVVYDSSRPVEVIDTGSAIREIQGLEFYGGMIVAGQVKQAEAFFYAGADLLTIVDRIYQQEEMLPGGLCILEGADLLRLKWTESSRIRILCR